jgi:acetyl esterase/lipase
MHSKTIAMQVYKKIIWGFIFLLLFIFNAKAQMPDFINTTFPKGTIFHQNIPYANDTLKKHLLDIYLPANATANTPLIIWVHGGAWMLNDKYADMGYMKNTIRTFLEKGYALASIDYRHSTTAIFPAQIRDCNQAVEFLFNNAAKYKLDKNRFALIGFSAGGHLASLLALSNNNNIPEFYTSGKKPSFKIKAVLDFYGPSDFLLFFANGDSQGDDPISILLGASPLKRPDISRMASSSSYVDKGDPAFFIVHGEKDESVPTTQSVLLKSYLDLAKVPNELTIVKGAPHYGEMFDTEDIRLRLFDFLEKHLK